MLKNVTLSTTSTNTVRQYDDKELNNFLIKTIISGSIFLILKINK